MNATTWTKKVGAALHEVRMTPIRLRDRAERRFAEWLFMLWKKDTRIGFKRRGDAIIAEIRIFGWRVGEQDIAWKSGQPPPASGPRAERKKP